MWYYHQDTVHNAVALQLEHVGRHPGVKDVNCTYNDPVVSRVGSEMIFFTFKTDECEAGRSNDRSLKRESCLCLLVLRCIATAVASFIIEVSISP